MSNRISTHYEGCWRDQKHHECAVARCERLQAEIERLREDQIAMHKLLTQAVIAWKQGHWNTLISEQQLYLSKTWFADARECVYREVKEVADE